MAAYGISKTLSCSYEEAEEKTREALAAEGFGVLTEIDVQATLKKKMDKDFRKYIILGACNPPYAYKALMAEIDLGLLLPCNVIVYENEGGGAIVSAIDPIVAMGMVENPTLGEVAKEVREKLVNVINSL